MASFHFDIPNIVTLPVIARIDDAIDSICFRELSVTFNEEDLKKNK